MLYDNALLSRVYLHAYQITKNPLYRRVVEETLDYIKREMTHPKGGFYSTQDADSEGEEGKFFLWTPEEVKAVLRDRDGEIFCKDYDITERGNFEDKNILNVPVAPEDLARKLGLKTEQLNEIIDNSRRKLFEVRKKRVKPGRDEKVLTAWNGLMLASFAALACLLTTARALERLGWIEGLPGPLARLERAAAPLASFNAYGLFSVMNRERPQILVEGSADGVEWRPYAFRYQPGALDRPPAFAGLHMPRLDWQLWFAGLEHDGPWRSEWTRDFLRCLLAGSPAVLALLAENPFPGEPPRFVRAEVALYRFASAEERRAGAWWQRGEVRPFLPVERR
jgi:hypothetical protein